MMAVVTMIVGMAVPVGRIVIAAVVVVAMAVVMVMTMAVTPIVVIIVILIPWMSPRGRGEHHSC